MVTTRRDSLFVLIVSLALLVVQGLAIMAMVFAAAAGVAYLIASAIRLAARACGIL